jgi:hypothetical protein
LDDDSFHDLPKVAEDRQQRDNWDDEPSESERYLPENNRRIAIWMCAALPYASKLRTLLNLWVDTKPMEVKNKNCLLTLAGEYCIL